MIVEKDQNIEALGGLKGERVQMDFAREAIGQLMDNMAKHLYARPKEAILREYSTNGWDAQVEIGETRPIEITLPSPIEPVLCIRDFGVGLDYEGIAKVYSQYGASTKRDSNDYNGTFGVGGKSAFAYSNRFTIVSVKNGRRTEVIVTRNEGGTAEMIVVTGKQGTPTDEPRGTTIKIPTRRGDDFVAEAAKLYRWFEPGSVLVNGEAPEYVRSDGRGHARSLAWHLRGQESGLGCLQLPPRPGDGRSDRHGQRRLPGPHGHRARSQQAPPRVLRADRLRRHPVQPREADL